MPSMSTVIVVREHPFHSLRIMPHTLEKTTLSAMSMHHEKARSVGDEVRNPLPSESPKNWLYHSTPAKAQNNRLLA